MPLVSTARLEHAEEFGNHYLFPQLHPAKQASDFVAGDIWLLRTLVITSRRRRSSLTRLALRFLHID